MQRITHMPDKPFPPLIPTRLTGKEPLHIDGNPLPHTLLDFWQWSVSDLVSNVTRGRLAEFIVATALGIDVSGVRSEWDPFDLTMPPPSCLKIEVKSAALIQSWFQARHSKITWRTPATRAWDFQTNRLAEEARRQADVYVFALLHHPDQETIDPMNTAQWSFFALATRVLDERKRSQHSITLPSLEGIAGPPVGYAGLLAAVKGAGEKQRQTAKDAPPGHL
ncbi:MAG TPA: hypothetical protein VG796_07095 [Verrucomicrobiales bacterium]|nr:hypothetical protein [Verrucomicrobiales bacterium]